MEKVLKQGFVLFAREHEEAKPVPIAHVIVLDEDVRFFEKLWRKGLDGNGLMHLVVLQYIRKHYPHLLAPYEGWDFFLQSEGVAVYKGYKIDNLPVVDMT